VNEILCVESSELSRSRHICLRGSREAKREAVREAMMTIFEVPEVGNENFKLLVKLTSLSFSDFNFERNNITVKE